MFILRRDDAAGGRQDQSSWSINSRPPAANSSRRLTRICAPSWRCGRWREQRPAELRSLAARAQAVVRHGAVQSSGPVSAAVPSPPRGGSGRRGEARRARPRRRWRALRTPEPLSATTSRAISRSAAASSVAGSAILSTLPAELAAAPRRDPRRLGLRQDRAPAPDRRRGRADRHSRGRARRQQRSRAPRRSLADAAGRIRRGRRGQGRRLSPRASTSSCGRQASPAAIRSPSICCPDFAAIGDKRDDRDRGRARPGGRDGARHAGAFISRNRPEGPTQAGSPRRRIARFCDDRRRPARRPHPTCCPSFPRTASTIGGAPKLAGEIADQLRAAIATNPCCSPPAQASTPTTVSRRRRTRRGFRSSISPGWRATRRGSPSSTSCR